MNNFFIHNNFQLTINQLLYGFDYLKKRCKYFSIEDLLTITLQNPEIIGTWAYDIKNNYNESIINIPFFYNYIPNKNYGKNIQVFDKNEDFVYYGTIKQLQYVILNDQYKLLIAMKIVCSSFFLWEAVSFVDKSHYAIYNNVYFNNIIEFQEFCRINKIESQILQWPQFLSTYDGFNFIKSIMEIKSDISSSFLIIHDNVFCPNAIVFDLMHQDKFNTNQFFYQTVQMNIKPKYFRYTIVKTNDKQSLYDSYMRNSLNLCYRSITNYFYGQIIDFLKHEKTPDLDLNISFPNCINLLKSIKSQTLFVNNLLFKTYNHEIVRLFFCTNNSEIRILKNFAKRKNLQKILIINITNCEENLFFIKTFEQLESVLLKY